MADGQNGPIGRNAMKADVEITQLAGKGIAAHHHQRMVEDHAWEINFNVDLATQLKVIIVYIANSSEAVVFDRKQPPEGVLGNLAKFTGRHQYRSLFSKSCNNFFNENKVFVIQLNLSCIVENLFLRSILMHFGDSEFFSFCILLHFFSVR